MINRQSNFLTAEECSELIDLFNNNEILSIRNPLIYNIKQKISDNIRRPIVLSEDISIRKIEVGETHPEKYSWFTSEDFYQFCLGSGNRISSAKIFLNKPSKGGGLWFPKHRLKIDPEVGQFVFWDDKTKGKFNSFTLHQDLEVAKGELYLLEVFFREKPYDPSKDRELYEEYQASGYKVETTSLNKSSYYILPAPKFTYNVGKEVQKLIQLVSPGTIHQSPELSQLLLGSINPTIQRVYKGATPFRVEEMHTFRSGQKVDLWKKHPTDDILNCLVVLDNPKHRNNPWTYYIKGPDGVLHEETIKEGSMLIYPMDQVKVSLKDPFDGLSYTILELQYKLKV